MKPLPVILAASLLANVVLAVLFVRSSTRPSASTTVASTRAATSEAANRTDGATAAATATASTWRHLHTTDLPALATRLRTGGFPPHVVRAIVEAEVRERFAARRRELLAQHPPPPYWRTGLNGMFDPALTTAMRGLDREQNDLLRAVLGPEGAVPDEMQLEMQRRRYGPLPAATLEKLERVASDYQDLRMGIQTRANGLLLPQEQAELELLAKEEQQDLAELLTPEQLREYQLRASQTAMQLRFRLAGLNPTEAEFREIYAAADALPKSGATPQREANAALLQALAGKLPPERLAELEQSLNPEYYGVNRLVDRLKLPRHAATSLMEVQKDILQRAATIRGNRQLSPAESAAQFAALREETTRRVIATVGATHFDAYESAAGGWMRLLNPPRPP